MIAFKFQEWECTCPGIFRAYFRTIWLKMAFRKARRILKYARTCVNARLIQTVGKVTSDMTYFNLVDRRNKKISKRCMISLFITSLPRFDCHLMGVDNSFHSHTFLELYSMPFMGSIMSYRTGLCTII